MVYNAIVGLGNTGTQIVKLASRSSYLENVKKFAIDSVASSADMSSISDVTYIPVISDDKTGSGRSRERGKAMYEYHESQGHFDEMYNVLQNSKSPVIVITSAAGGTGSGSIVPFCKTMIEKGIDVIPIIVVPNMNDPDAYHLNTNDLMIELDELEIKTYSIFRNVRSGANYDLINKQIVELIEIIFGTRYDETEMDSIDDSDLDVVLSTPGRFIAVSVSADNVEDFKKELTRKVFNGYQPAWTPKESEEHTFITACSLSWMFASNDFEDAFSEINARIKNSFDEYRNKANIDNDGKCFGTLIVAGLPHAELKVIDSKYRIAEGMSSGMKRAERPSFLTKKKATITKPGKTIDGDSVIAQFDWK